ncbi:MAG: hypothetical protein AAGJ79_05665 [Verrucomicrobiota bacterium]
MPQSPLPLIHALRSAADRLAAGARYEWGHLARCNCGHLIQSLTGMDSREISCAVDHELEEWSEHAKAYCPQSGRAVDEVFETLGKVGFGREDVIHLENLSDRRVLGRLGGNVHLRRNSREDVIRYMRAMADMLEDEASHGVIKSKNVSSRVIPSLLAGAIPG